VVVNLPQGLGRYGVENAVTASATTPGFEWYLKNHLGSTLLVYGTDSGSASVKAAYDYRAFGEQVSMVEPADKVTENFTGKELDDETGLGNHGARMLDPMIGMWIAVDPRRFFPSPYLYMGNGYNPIRFADLTGEKPGDAFNTSDEAVADWGSFTNSASKGLNVEYFAFIYKTDDNKYIAAMPTMCSKDAFTISDMQRNRLENPSLATLQAVTMTHTHGAEDFFGLDDGYDNDNFSSEDKMISNLLELDLYLVNPKDELKLYGSGTENVETDN